MASCCRTGAGALGPFTERLRAPLYRRPRAYSRRIPRSTPRPSVNTIERWLQSKRALKPSTVSRCRETVDLYLVPGLGQVDCWSCGPSTWTASTRPRHEASADDP